MVNNPSENMGSFWYIQVEMFKDRLEFMKMMYLLLQFTMCCFVAIMIQKTFDVAYLT
jgi:hypothetical protein